MPPKQSDRPPMASRVFRRSAKTCPHCKGILETSDAQCLRCGFGFAYLTELMPGPGPEFGGVMDFCQLIPQDHSKITAEIERIRKFFPQVNPAICLVNSPENVAPHHLALWMINQATGEDAPEWRTLLFIDPARRQHTFVSGYALEAFFERQELERILDSAGQWFFDQEWESGIEVFLHEFFDLLKEASQFSTWAEKEALKTQNQ